MMKRLAFSTFIVSALIAFNYATYVDEVQWEYKPSFSITSVSEDCPIPTDFIPKLISSRGVATVPLDTFCTAASNYVRRRYLKDRTGTMYTYGTFSRKWLSSTTDESIEALKCISKPSDVYIVKDDKKYTVYYEVRNPDPLGLDAPTAPQL